MAELLTAVGPMTALPFSGHWNVLDRARLQARAVSFDMEGMRRVKQRYVVSLQNETSNREPIGWS
jgi:hypothetical protein